MNNDPEDSGCGFLSFLPCCWYIDKLFASMIKETVEWVYTSIMTKEDIFEDQETSNHTRTIAFRIGGWLLLWLGIYLLFSPLLYLIKIIPFVGYLVAQGVSLVVGIFALLAGTTLALLTISLAWIFYRPPLS